MSAWDTGVRWQTAILERNTAFVAVAVEFLRQHVLRAGDEVSADAIKFLIQSATALGERWTGAHISPKTLTLTLDAFPDVIEFADGPVREVTSVTYIDAAGAEQSLDVSPPAWVFVDGGRFQRATLRPAVGDSWPATQVRPDAVVVTFTVGYETAAAVPVEIQQAVAVTAGELYKSPDLSNADGLTPNIITLERFWPRRWANGV